MQSYHKRYLVPFAERWPSILGNPPSDLASLEPGRETTVLHVGDISFGVLICFEIADSRGARTLASRGAGFIVNLTNDAWFYRSSAPHVPWAVARAVETGIPVVRAANAGVSAVFDRFGRKVATGPSAGLPSVLAVSLPAAAPTVYSRTGDWFLVICLADSARRYCTRHSAPNASRPVSPEPISLTDVRLSWISIGCEEGIHARNGDQGLVHRRQPTALRTTCGASFRAHTMTPRPCGMGNTARLPTLFP
ncbi:MAG: hypothetical protein E6G67_12545 [Actinobacteria bacterium]|nr:MAG: hypothetical protein E6G67_12545 [Actinomycetota bacterium]